MGAVMGEVTLAQIILTMSLQQAGLNTDSGKFDTLLADKILAEKVIVTMAPSGKRAKLIDILNKNENSISVEEQVFIDGLIKDNSNKFSDGKGQWD